MLTDGLNIVHFLFILKDVRTVLQKTKGRSI